MGLLSGNGFYNTLFSSFEWDRIRRQKVVGWESSHALKRFFYTEHNETLILKRVSHILKQFSHILKKSPIHCRNSPLCTDRSWCIRFQQLLHINVQRLRGGLVFKAHRLLYHSTLGLRVVKQKKKFQIPTPQAPIQRTSFNETISPYTAERLPYTE